MNRRGFLSGILAAGVAPAFVGSGVLMPVKTIWTPVSEILLLGGEIIKVDESPANYGTLKVFRITETNGAYKKGQTFTIAGLYA